VKRLKAFSLIPLEETNQVESDLQLKHIFSLILVKVSLALMSSTLQVHIHPYGVQSLVNEFQNYLLNLLIL